MDFHGLVAPSALPGILRHAGCSVDLTGMVGGDRFKGQITCTMLEPMMYGCVSVVDESMVYNKNSLLYHRDDLVWPIGSKNKIAQGVNSLMFTPKLRRSLAKRAYRYVKRYHDSKEIIERLFMMFLNECSGKDKPRKSHFISDYKHFMEAQ